MEVVLDQLNLRLKDAAQTLQILHQTVKSRGPQAMSWSDVLDSLVVLETKISNIARMLASEHVPALHNQVLVPMLLTTDPSDQLQAATDNRVATFTHESVPAFLQTKHLLELERRDQVVSGQAQSMTMADANAAIDELNRACDAAIAVLDSKRRTFEAKYSSAQATNTSGTAEPVPLLQAYRLSTAMYTGEGLKVPSAAAPT